MPLLSELLASNSNPSIVYGMVVDVDDVTPPDGVKEVAICSALVDGALNETVLDVAISYILAGIDVTIEIEAETPVNSPKELISTAASVGASLSLLPPQDGSDASFESHLERVESFAVTYTKQANFAKLLIPVTSYLQYLFIEVIDPEIAKDFRPTDPYLLTAFVERMDPDRIDRMKDRIKAVFHEAYGGPEGFLTLGKMLFREVFERVEEGFIDQPSQRSDPNTPLPA